jgi:hypothetical protein
MLTSDVDPFIDANSKVLPNGNSVPIDHEFVTREEGLFAAPIGDLEELLTKKKPKSTAPNHNERTRAFWERQGYLYYHGEGQEIVTSYRDGKPETFAGRKFDILGLFDALAIKPGEPLIGVQVCAKLQFNKHLRSMCSHDIDKRSGNRKNVDNLRIWLAMGFRAVVLTWEERAKVGSQKYFAELYEVTAETIDMVAARRRK